MEVRFGQPNTYGATLGEVRGLGGGLNNGIPNINLHGTGEPTSDIGVDSQLYIQDINPPVAWIKSKGKWSKASPDELSILKISSANPDDDVQVDADKLPKSFKITSVGYDRVDITIVDGSGYKTYIFYRTDETYAERYYRCKIEDGTELTFMLPYGMGPRTVTVSKSNINEDVSQLKQDILNKADKSELEKVSKAQQIDRDMIKSIVGDWYTEDKVTSYANEVSVPSNAYPYAELQMIGGMSRKCVNVMPSADVINKSKDGVTFTCDGKGTYTFKGTATANGDFRVNLKQPFVTPFSINAVSTDKGKGCLFLNNNVINTKFSIIFASKGFSDGWGLNVVNRISDNYNTVGGKTITELRFSYTLGDNLDVRISPMFSDNGLTTNEFEPYFPSLIDAKVDEVVGKNTITIPQAIIDLCPNYGIGVNSDCYNYIDFVEKKYHRRVSKYHITESNYRNKYSDYYYFNLPTDAPSPATGKNGTAIASNGQVYEFNYNSIAFFFSTTTQMIYGKGLAYNWATETELREWLRNNPYDIYYKMETEEIIDLADVWVEDLDILNVEGNGTVKFSYENDDVYNVDVPNTILYQEKA